MIRAPYLLSLSSVPGTQLRDGKRVTGITWRHQRFHVWWFCWQIPGIQLGLGWNIYKWTFHRSQFGLLAENWILRQTMPKEQGRSAFQCSIWEITQCCFCHTLLAMAVIKSHPCTRTRGIESNTQWEEPWSSIVRRRVDWEMSLQLSLERATTNDFEDNVGGRWTDDGQKDD